MFEIFMCYFLLSFLFFGFVSLLYFKVGVNSEKYDFFERLWKVSIWNWLFALIPLGISVFI